MNPVRKSPVLRLPSSIWRSIASRSEGDRTRGGLRGNAVISITPAGGVAPPDSPALSFTQRYNPPTAVGDIQSTPARYAPMPWGTTPAFAGAGPAPCSFMYARNPAAAAVSSAATRWHARRCWICRKAVTAAAHVSTPTRPTRKMSGSRHTTRARDPARAGATSRGIASDAAGLAGSPSVECWGAMVMAVRTSRSPSARRKGVEREEWVAGSLLLDREASIGHFAPHLTGFPLPQSRHPRRRQAQAFRHPRPPYRSSPANWAEKKKRLRQHVT